MAPRGNPSICTELIARPDYLSSLSAIVLVQNANKHFENYNAVKKKREKRHRSKN